LGALTLTPTKLQSTRERRALSILDDIVQQLANFINGKRKDMEFNIPAGTIQSTSMLDLPQRLGSLFHQMKENGWVITGRPCGTK
jgi:hypothetical protein